MIYFALPMVGFWVGFLIISVGGGGGGIYVGILTALFNISPAIAASTSLATIIPTTAIGTVSHWKAGNIHFRFGLIMLVGGAVGAIIGSLFSSVFPKNLYNKFTGIIILLLGVQMIVSFVRRRKLSNAKKAINSHKYGTVLSVIFGVLGGCIIGACRHKREYSYRCGSYSSRMQCTSNSGYISNGACWHFSHRFFNASWNRKC